MPVRLKSIVAQTIGLFVILALALFVPAGTAGWAAGWVFWGLFLACFVGVTLWLGRHNPALLQERFQLRRAGQPGWDRLYLPLMLLVALAWLVFMALDAGRLRWSPLPVWLQPVGAVVLMGAFYLLFRTFRENAFLSPVVRMQKDRGQTVISTGPYHYVRHPMYAGLLLFVIGTSLLLGSGYGILVGMFFMALLARRSVLEERTLRNELPGYDAYMVSVRYRLIPYVW